MLERQAYMHFQASSAVLEWNDQEMQSASWPYQRRR